MKKLFILLLFLGTTVYGQRQRLIEITQDTLTRPRSSQIVGIAGLNSTFYLVPRTGNAIRMARFTELQSLSAQLSTKENSFTKNTAFNKSFGTAAGTVMEGNYTPQWTNISGKPSTFPYVSEFNSKWDSVRNAGFTVDNLSVLNSIVNDNGNVDFGQASINSLYVEELELDQGGTGSNGTFIKYNNGLGYDSVSVADVSGLNQYLTDTLNQRAILNIPDHVAESIPDSHHIVLEPDYIKAWQVNTDFGTVPLGYYVVSVGLDSTELTLQKPNYDISYTIFCTCFDDTIFGYYDTVAYKTGIFGSTDSLTQYKAQSILYFSDTIWVDLDGHYKYSNYISNEHPINQFRSKSQYLGATIIWDNKQKKYFLK